MRPKPSMIDFRLGSDPRDTVEMARALKVMLSTHEHPNLKEWPSWLTSANDFGEDADHLDAAIERAKGHDVTMVQQRDELDMALKKRMIRVGQFVELAVDGDLNALKRAGFKIRPLRVKKPTTGLPPAPEITAVHGKTSGTFSLKLSRSLNAKSYRVQITDQDPSTNPTWMDVDDFPRATNIIIENREPGRLYWLRASILSSAGRGPWSIPVSIRSL